MNHWAFIAAAYGLALLATLGLTLASFLAMRRAERTADALKSER